MITDNTSTVKCFDESNAQLQPKIYVACLAAYNEGYLHGAWIDANHGKDEIYKEINNILKSSPISGAEEWAIHDYEDFGEMNISENEGVRGVIEYVDILHENGEMGASVLAYCGNDVDDAKSLLDEYCGCYENKAEFAEQLMNDCYELPKYLEPYIDYEKFARDLFINDYLSLEANNKVHVFRYV